MLGFSFVCLALFCLDRSISMCLGLKMPCSLLDACVCVCVCVCVSLEYKYLNVFLIWLRYRTQ